MSFNAVENDNPSAAPPPIAGSLLLRGLAWHRAVLVGAAFILGYLLLDWISYIHPTTYFNITPWNPQPALAIALLMLGGRRWLPAVFLATFFAELIHRMPTPFPVGLFVAGLLTLGYWIIAQGLASLYPITLTLSSRRDVLRLVGIVTGISLVMGLLYSAILLASGIGLAERYLGAILRFWIGNSVGIVVTLPLILMLLDAERRLQMKQMLWRVETVVQIVAIGAVLWIVFSYSAGDFSLFYLLFLPVIWVATRSGMVGTALFTAVIQAGIILAVQMHDYQTLSVFELQALLMALTITGFFLGVTVEERERTALELRESLRLAAAGEMAGALAHELNQPLTALLSYAKASRLLANSNEARGPLLQETLQKLVNEATRASEVVRRLRDFFSTGATQLERASLPKLADDVIASLRPRAVAAGIDIERHVIGEIPEILVDCLQIQVVMRNLIVNALDAVADAPEGRRRISVEISTDTSGNIRFVVIDSGPGIGQEQMQYLFEPFSTTKATGMGMGLAISRAIIEGHGGTLWAKPGNHGTVGFTLGLREAVDG
jgi:two-component system, LuxR family, sensor kinase FixL